jgi:hypothetical protein
MAGGGHDFRNLARAGEDECGRKIGGAPMVRTNEGRRLNLPERSNLRGKVWGAVGPVFNHANFRFRGIISLLSEML